MVQLWRQWCRLCASEDSSNTHINIFLKDQQMCPLSEALMKYFSINIDHSDDWPQTICTKCHKFVTTIVLFAQRASKAQALFADLYNGVENVIDAEHLKAQYELNELGDLEFDFNLFANSSPVQLFEPKPLATEVKEQMIDLEELEYIDEEMLNPTKIKTEHTDEEVMETQEEEEEWKTLSVSIEDAESDDYSSPKSEAESEESAAAKKEQPKAKTKGRPKRRYLSQKQEENECPECAKSFTRYSHYRQHMQTEHGITLEKSSFPCTQCEKTFTTPRRLRIHENIHLPSGEKFTVPCPFCDKKFTKGFIVQAHIRTVHTGEKPFICEECGKTYKTFGALKEHKLTHTDERPFKCSSCEKKFKSKSRLKTHEDTHTDTNYVCTTCGLQLNTRRTLKMHMLVHSDQKRHKCEYCGSEYKRAKALKNHLILHTGLKPYTCNFCDKTFANGSNCRSHKKKAHSAELAAMEAAGTKSVTTNIPKLEQLRAVTSHKAAIIQGFAYEQEFGGALTMVATSEDVESAREQDSPAEMVRIH